MKNFSLREYKIGSKIIIFFTTLIITVCLLFGIISLRMSANALKHLAFEQMLTTVNQSSLLIRSELDTIITGIESLALRDELTNEISWQKKT